MHSSFFCIPFEFLLHTSRCNRLPGSWLMQHQTWQLSPRSFLSSIKENHILIFLPPPFVFFSFFLFFHFTITCSFFLVFFSISSPLQQARSCIVGVNHAKNLFHRFPPVNCADSPGDCFLLSYTRDDFFLPFKTL